MDNTADDTVAGGSGTAGQLRPGRAPTIQTFIRTANKYGIDSEQTRQLLDKLSYVQLGRLRGHPDFQTFLDGVVFKAFLSGRELTRGEKWSIRYLRDDRKADGRGKSDDMPISAEVIREGDNLEAGGNKHTGESLRIMSNQARPA